MDLFDGPMLFKFPSTHPKRVLAFVVRLKVSALGHDLNKSMAFDWHSTIKEINDEFFVWCSVFVHETFLDKETVDETLEERFGMNCFDWQSLESLQS
jgi:hypothetical protein